MNNDNIRKNSMYTAMFCDMVYILIVAKNFHANNYTKFSTKTCIRKFGDIEPPLPILCLNNKEVTWICYHIDGKRKRDFRKSGAIGPPLCLYT